jgi:sugar/nucleoside kinase (ribokinase family)
MSLLVIGSLALDTIETPFGKKEYTLGGSATFISVSASYFTENLRLVGIVGYDFPAEEIDFLKSKKIDTSGLIISKEYKTFHWHGKYHTDMNNRDSITTELNAFAHFDPVISKEFINSDYVCLGNVDPVIQLKVIKQLNKPKLIMADTMNFWIEGKPDSVIEMLKHINILVINDSEVRLLAKENNLIKAAKIILKMGPKILIIKKGEYGAMLLTSETIFSVPAYPIEDVKDPTGAGDSFAGGLIGWISKTNDYSDRNLKKAIIWGTIMASLSVQSFSLESIRKLKQSEINERYNKFIEILNYN